MSLTGKWQHGRIVTPGVDDDDHTSLTTFMPAALATAIAAGRVHDVSAWSSGTFRFFGGTGVSEDEEVQVRIVGWPTPIGLGQPTSKAAGPGIVLAQADVIFGANVFGTADFLVSDDKIAVSDVWREADSFANSHPSNEALALFAANNGISNMPESAEILVNFRGVHYVEVQMDADGGAGTAAQGPVTYLWRGMTGIVG